MRNEGAKEDTEEEVFEMHKVPKVKEFNPISHRNQQNPFQC